MLVGPSALGGSGLFAGRTAEGRLELLGCEPPLVACLTDSAAGSRCAQCWSEARALRVCGGCRRARFCSAACQRQAWTAAGHRAECGAVLPAAHSGETARLALRLLAAGGLPGGRVLPDVGARLEPERQAAVEAEAAAVATACGRPPEEVRRALLRLHCCAMRVPDPADGGPLAVGLYATASAANHSCAPSAAAIFDARGLLSLLALRPLAAGQELLLCYVDSALPRLLRRFQLHDTWRIARCDCTRCTTEPDAFRGRLAPELLFDAYAAFGNSSRDGGPAVRARFLAYAAAQPDEPAQGTEDADWRAAIDFARKAAELAGAAHHPALRFAELVHGYLDKRPLLFPVGSYFWAAATQRLALQLVKTASSLPEAEMVVMLQRAREVNASLADSLTGNMEQLPTLLGIHIINARALLWEASYVADLRGRAAMAAVVVAAEKELSRVAELENVLFKHTSSNLHGWQRDSKALREQYEELRAAAYT